MGSGWEFVRAVACGDQIWWEGLFSGLVGVAAQIEVIFNRPQRRREGEPMLEQKINELFGDQDPTGFGTGWWSGVLSAFFGLLAFGAVVCLHFPQLLTFPHLPPYYSMYVLLLLMPAALSEA